MFDSSITRRATLGGIALAVAGLGYGTAAAQNQAATGAYPNKPIRIIVSYAPGGATDAMARVLGDKMGKSMGVPIVVENKPGAGGIIGTEATAKAAPDGYTVSLALSNSIMTNQFIYPKLPYDPNKDLSYIYKVADGPQLLVVQSSLPVKSLKDFADYLKANPGKVSYCSWGNGSGGHLAMESLMKQTGMQMTHVPYKGSAPCVQDLVGGQVQAAFADTSSTIPMIQAGKMRVLAHSGEKRYPKIPEVQSLNELGYPFTTYAWYGILAPAKTPRPIVDQLNKAMNKVMADPEVRKHLAELNMVDLPPSSPEQFGATISRDLKSWGELIKGLNMPLQ